MSDRNDPYLEWVRQGLKKPGKSQSGLARHLGLDPSAINKLVNGTRILKGPEILPTAEYLGEPPPSANSASGLSGNSSEVDAFCAVLKTQSPALQKRAQKVVLALIEDEKENQRDRKNGTEEPEDT